MTITFDEAPNTMESFQCYTLVDITNTGVNDPQKTKAYNQYQNLNTLIQCIGLRALPMLLESKLLENQDLSEYQFGSKYKNKLIGTHGNLTMFSLQAIKHLTSIDGGLLLSPHRDLYKRSKLIRWYGIDRDDNRKDFRCEANIEEWGFKFHMNDVCATVGNENLKCVNGIISKHKSNAKFYDENLANVNGLTQLSRNPEFDSAFWIYSTLVNNRDDFYRWMNECGIVVSQVHERNDKHTCVKDYKTHLPTLDKTIGKIVSIPVGWWVSDEQREYIVDCIKKGW